MGRLDPSSPGRTGFPDDRRRRQLAGRDDRGGRPGTTRARSLDETGSTSLRARTRDALRELGIRPRKRWGQNFLVDDRVAERIVAEATVDHRVVVEIGPGLGVLSEYLVGRADRLVLVELDPILAGRLEAGLGKQAGVRVLCADALEVDLDVIAPPGSDAVVVANLPYNVGSQILLRCLEEGERFRRLVFMLQYEVARRVVAVPGTRDYGLLSIWTALRGTARILFRVPPRAFLPPPRVSSAVVSIDLLKELPVSIRSLDGFRELVRASFRQRRKTLGRALAGLLDASDFEAAGIDPRRRGETLALDELASLANRLAAKRSANA